MNPQGMRTRVVAAELHPPIDHHPGCITCGDTTTRMRVLEVDGPHDLALCVDEHERRQRVDTGIVGAVAPGEMLLVHAGTALVRESI